MSDDTPEDQYARVRRLARERRALLEQKAKLEREREVLEMQLRAERGRE